MNLSQGGDPLYEVEIYAEGNVRDTSRRGAPLESHRAQLRAPEVKIQAYGRGGVNALRSPPQSLDILRRSGFSTPRRSAAAADMRAAAEAATRTAPQTASARSRAEETSGRRSSR